jgi:hypothetical protein
MDNVTFIDLAGTQNVAVASDGKFTYIRLENDVAGTRSKSGKSIVVASTHGNVKVGALTIGLNVYHK